MDKPVSAADANRNLSQLLRGVRQGHSYVITSHGKPIARIIPTTESAAARERAKAALFKRLHSQRATDIGHWSREELYED